MPLTLSFSRLPSVAAAASFTAAGSRRQPLFFRCFHAASLLRLPRYAITQRGFFFFTCRIRCRRPRRRHATLPALRAAAVYAFIYAYADTICQRQMPPPAARRQLYFTMIFFSPPRHTLRYAAFALFLRATTTYPPFILYRSTTTIRHFSAIDIGEISCSDHTTFQTPAKRHSGGCRLPLAATTYATSLATPPPLAIPHIQATLPFSSYAFIMPPRLFHYVSPMPLMLTRARSRLLFAMLRLRYALSEDADEAQYRCRRVRVEICA